MVVRACSGQHGGRLLIEHKLMEFLLLNTVASFVQISGCQGGLIRIS